LTMLSVRKALEGKAEGGIGERDEAPFWDAMRVPVWVEKLIACKGFERFS
jgi:hypothetical protein